MSIGGGTPDPGQWIRGQSITAPVTAAGGELVGSLYAGATVANGVTYQRRINIGGASSARVRFKCSAGGTLKCSFMDPLGQSAYTTGNPSNVTVTANVEAMIDTNSIYGEGWALIEFVSGGAGTVSLFDAFAL